MVLIEKNVRSLLPLAKVIITYEHSRALRSIRCKHIHTHHVPEPLLFKSQVSCVINLVFVQLHFSSFSPADPGVYSEPVD